MHSFQIQTRQLRGLARRVSIALASAALVLVVGCDSPSDEQKKLDRAQYEADKKIEGANQAANAKLETAKSEASNSLALAKLDFDKSRDAFQTKKSEELAALDVKIAGLESGAVGKTGATKADYDTKLPKIRALRAQMAGDIKAIAGSSSQGWTDLSARLDKESKDLTKLIDAAPQPS